MVTLLNIQARAEALSRKVEVGSITAEEVGTLFRDIAEYTQSIERDGSTLGIRKVYPSREALEADATAPTGHNGKPIRRGSLVAIYDEATATTDSDSGLVLMYTGEGFLPVARIGTALRHETTALETRLASTERLILEELRPKDTELRELLESLSQSIQTTFGEHTNALQEVKTAVAETAEKVSHIKTDAGADKYLRGDGSYQPLPTYSLSTALKEETKTATTYDIKLSETEGEAISTATLTIPKGGGGSGSGFLNLTREVPLQAGYYTLDTALTALATLSVDEAERKGLIITFERSEGKWSEYRFVGQAVDDTTFHSAPMWQAYNSVDEAYITQKLSEYQPTIELAQSVDDTDRPVASSAVKEALDEVQHLTFDSDVTPTEDGSQVTLSHKGREVAQFTVRGGGGSGDAQGTATSTKVVALLSQNRTKLGDKVSMTYGFTHSTEGEVDGTIATLSLLIKRGKQKVAEETLGTLTSGETAQLDLTPYITSADTYSISIIARYEEGGQPKERTAYASLSVVNLAISLYNKGAIAEAIARGGYRQGETAPIVISVKGGAKVLSLYIDGTLHEEKTLSRSGGTQTFMLPIDTLSAGSHSLQVVASIEGLRSNSLYLDILKHGGEGAFIGWFFSRADGAIAEGEATPRVLAYQYEGVSWEYIVRSPEAGGVARLVVETPEGERTLATPRTYQPYTTRFLREGDKSFLYRAGDVTRSLSVELMPTTLEGIGIKEGAVVELRAEGRSNQEAQPNAWSFGGVTTTFSGVDFSSSGWHTSRRGQGATSVPCLRLLNGAKALVGYKPFARDAKERGLSISFEAKIDNIRRYEGAVVSCFDEVGLRSGGFGGLRMTASRIELPLGGTETFRSEEGEDIVRHLGLSMPTASGEYYAITLVIHPESEERTMRLYVNGVLSKADTYQNDIFVQENPQGILLDSTDADLEIRYLRIYETALSDDEVLDNYITDRPTLHEMQTLRERNDVLSQDGNISYDKLRLRGKAVLTLTMAGGIETLWGKSTDTKTDHRFEELIFRSPYGRAYDLKVTSGIVRRQGTSTSTYPIKNLRIYLQKHQDTKVYRNVGTEETDVWEVISDRTYRMRPDALPMKIINLKTDYADSSLCYNTGTAILLNDHLVAQHPTLQNPGQRSHASARMAIDGMPMSLFTNDRPEGKPRYCGQFQFNNDKSKSGYLFGQTKKDGMEIALEFINNTNPVANFAIEGDVAEQLGRKGTEGFDDSVEFLYPEKDYLWNGKTPETTAPDNIKQAIIRLWQFIKDCTPQGVDPSTMTEAEVRRAFVSEKFKREVGQYFDVRNLTLWWVLTDYHMSVDQRVKNTFFRTWDSRQWWLTYYDGDTAFGKRNDAVLAYDYNINRDTRDHERSKFAFEGHNSRLWCLVIANLEEELKASAKLLRQSLTNKVYLDIFNRQMMGAWSEREYNKSGIYKYIKPTYTNYNNGGVMNYIFALGGTMEAFRNQLLSRRFSMLDARYLVGQYESDAITGYVGKGSVATEIRLTAGDEYYFGWKTQNGKLTDYQHALLGGEAVFSYPDAMSQNDPIRLIGASRIRKIDFATTAPYLQGAWNFNTSKQLEEVVARVEQGNPSPWFMQLRGISGLRRIDLTGQSGVSGTEGAGSTEFDISTHSGLRELLLGGTAVRSVRIAGGSPMTRLVLPRTLTSLRLVALPELRPEGLVLEDWASVRTLWLSACPHIDWQTLVGRCTNLERLRIEGVDFEDDGTLLSRLASMRGVGERGEGVETCSLVGRCQLSRYVDDETLRQYREHFPTLDIRQPQYTVIEIDDNVADPGAIRNLDNNTGYGTGKPYAVSGHIKAILEARYQCVGKQSERGVMHICPLDEDDSTKYYDKETRAEVLYADGDTFVYEPEYWYKGVNDLVKGKKYICFAKDKPDEGRATVLNLEDVECFAHRCFSTTRANTGQGCLTGRTRGYDVYRLSVEGYRKVRVPMAIGQSSAHEGGAFVDEGDNIVERLYYPSIDGHLPNMYLIFDIPEGAKHLYWQVLRGHRTPEMCVVLSRTNAVIDLEPKYCHHRERLIGAYPAYFSEGGNPTIGSFYTSNYDATSHVYDKERSYFEEMFQLRGLSITDYDSYKHIALLLWAKYGTRRPNLVGESTRAGSHAYNIGMHDFMGHAWGAYYYPSNGEKRQIVTGHTEWRYWTAARTSSRFMGYARMFSSHNEFIAGITKPAGIQWQDENLRFTALKEGERTIPITHSSSQSVRRIVLGLHCDPLIAHRTAGSDTTYYISSQDIGSIPQEEMLLVTGSGGVGQAGPIQYHARGLNLSNNTTTARPMFYGQIIVERDIEAYKRIPLNY